MALIFWTLSVLLISGTFVMKWLLVPKKKEISWKEFVESYLANGWVREVQVVNKEWVRVISYGPGDEVLWFAIGNLRTFESDIKKLEQQNNISINITHKNELQLFGVLYTILDVLPGIVCLAVIVAIILGMMGFIGINNVGPDLQAGLPNSAVIGGQTNSPLKFKDIVGCDEAKVEIMELVNFLKYPEMYKTMGAKIPRGALLFGPPGTGKTLLARAAAAEANVTFVAMAGPAFNEIFVGMGPQRVRQLFAYARRNSPSIIFIDEIDSISKKRRMGSSGGDSETDNTLNQLLIEMDGFKPKELVIILAATNRIDSLDPALMRPGRFDRIVNVPAPNLKGRTDLFAKYLDAVHLDTSLTLLSLADELAKYTPGFTGAEIAGVCNEAAILATRNEQCAVERHNFYEAIDRSLSGMGHMQPNLSPEDLRVVAYHEAGHTVAAWFLEHGHSLVKVTIKAKGSALGYNQFLPREVQMHTDEQIFQQMCVLLGGRVAEELFFDKKLSTGATSDLQKVTQMAYGSIMEWGMSRKLGPLSFSSQDDGSKFPLSEEFSKLIDSEVQNLVAKALKDTEELLTAHKDDISKIAEALLDRHTLNADDVSQLVGPRPFAALPQQNSNQQQ